jgi:hypothetical protein
MAHIDMLNRIAKIIAEALEFEPVAVCGRWDGSLACRMRDAAMLVHDELPNATSSDFGDAAVLIGLHRQSSMNRWNETRKIWGDDW